MAKNNRGLLLTSGFCREHFNELYHQLKDIIKIIFDFQIPPYTSKWSTVYKSHLVRFKDQTKRVVAQGSRSVRCEDPLPHGIVTKFEYEICVPNIFPFYFYGITSSRNDNIDKVYEKYPDTSAFYDVYGICPPANAFICGSHIGISYKTHWNKNAIKTSRKSGENESNLKIIFDDTKDDFIILILELDGEKLGPKYQNYTFKIDKKAITKGKKELLWYPFICINGYGHYCKIKFDEI